MNSADGLNEMMLEKRERRDNELTLTELDSVIQKRIENTITEARAAKGITKRFGSVSIKIVE